MRAWCFPILGGSITDLSVADDCLFGRRWRQSCPIHQYETGQYCSLLKISFCKNGASAGAGPPSFHRIAMGHGVRSSLPTDPGHLRCRFPTLRQREMNEAAS